MRTLSAGMNWCGIIKAGLIKAGDSLTFVGKKKTLVVEVQEGGAILYEGEVFARPGQLWTAQFKMSKAHSWLDSCYVGSKTIRQIRSQRVRVSERKSKRLLGNVPAKISLVHVLRPCL